ncbi:MAG: hypothetical protein ACOCPU_03030 [Methanohalophilus sp.]
MKGPIKCSRCDTTNEPTEADAANNRDDEMFDILMDAIKHNPDIFIETVQKNKTNQ